MLNAKCEYEGRLSLRRDECEAVYIYKNKTRDLVVVGDDSDKTCKRLG